MNAEITVEGRLNPAQNIQVPDAPFSRLADRGVALLNMIGPVLAALAAGGLAAIVAMMGYEIVARNVFNSPTTWSVELVTYLVVATAFLPLGYLQRQGGHIQVDIVVNALPSEWQSSFRRFGLLLAFFLVALMTWQFAAYLLKDYSAGSRDFGLQATPLWIPQTPVFVGLVGLLIAIFVDVLKSANSSRPGRVILAIGVVALTSTLLISLGIKPAYFASRTLDWGSVSVLVATTTIGLLIYGYGVSSVFAIVVAASGLIAYGVSDYGTASIGVFIALGLITFLLTGMPICFAIGFVALLGLYFFLPMPQLSLLADRPWRSLNSFTYSAVPMFVLMGSILIRTRASSSFFGAVSAWMGGVPGSLAHASLLASGLFATISGSSIATAATIGQVATPEMLKRGYSPRLALGSVAAGGTLGILIPPSVPMIIYGAAVGAPVTLLFMAGILPGLLMLLSLMVGAYVWAITVRGSAPRTAPVAMREKLRALQHFLPFVALFVCVLGSLYFGLVTPTEAGAMGVLLSIVVSAIDRTVSVSMLAKAAMEAAMLSAAILFIVVATSTLTWVMDYAQLPQSMVAAIQSWNLPPLALLLLIGVFYVVLGMFIDPISMMLMTLSVTYPIVQLAGYDAIWFGVALMILIEVGLITPPVGMILFVLRGLFPAIPLKDIVLGSFPFVLVILGNLVVIAVFPQIVTWLPSLMVK